MVSALFAEFLSHRMHEATVQAWSKPGLVTRVLLLSFQVGCTPCLVMWPCTASSSPQVQWAQVLLISCARRLLLCHHPEVMPCHNPGMRAQCECVLRPAILQALAVTPPVPGCHVKHAEHWHLPGLCSPASSCP